MHLISSCPTCNCPAVICCLCWCWRPVLLRSTLVLAALLLPPSAAAAAASLVVAGLVTSDQLSSCEESRATLLLHGVKHEGHKGEGVTKALPRGQHWCGCRWGGLQSPNGLSSEPCPPQCSHHQRSPADTEPKEEKGPAQPCYNLAHRLLPWLGRRATALWPGSTTSAARLRLPAALLGVS